LLIYFHEHWHFCRAW